MTYYEPNMMGSEVFIIPHSLITSEARKGISRGEVFAYAVIKNILDAEAFNGTSHRDRKGYYTTASWERIARTMGITIRNALRTKRQMEKHGLIEVEGKHGYQTWSCKTYLAAVE